MVAVPIVQPPAAEAAAACTTPDTAVTLTVPSGAYRVNYDDFRSFAAVNKGPDSGISAVHILRAYLPGGAQDWEAYFANSASHSFASVQSKGRVYNTSSVIHQYTYKRSCTP